MPIYRHKLGQFLKVHSFNATPPEHRREVPVPGAASAPIPQALMVVCHGIYTNSLNEMIQIPNVIQVRFAAVHGKPNDNIDYKYFDDLFKCGLNNALEFDFKVTEKTNQVLNYYLGKGEPDMKRGATPADWLSYNKTDRLKRPVAFDERKLRKNISKTGVLSSAYVEGLMLLAQKHKQYSFDIATVRRSCRSLRNVFDTIVATNPRYKYLLCAFCRELAPE